MSMIKSLNLFIKWTQVQRPEGGLGIGGISLFLTVVSFFLAPALVESDTISDSSGRANMSSISTRNDQKFHVD